MNVTYSTTLGAIIQHLASLPPDMVVPRGFDRPHSYRGCYDEVAFRPAANVTVGHMLDAARSALGQTFEGYKGGDFTMDAGTNCWLAEYGKFGVSIVLPGTVPCYVLPTESEDDRAVEGGVMAQKSDGVRGQIDGMSLGDEFKKLVFKRAKIDPSVLICPREKSDMTPCVARDGGLAVAFAGDTALCAGCEVTVKKLLLDEKAKHPKVPAGKYTKIDPRTKLHPDEPYFFLRSQDLLAPAAVEAYASLLEVASRATTGPAKEQLANAATSVRDFAARMRNWQVSNADKTKLPD